MTEKTDVFVREVQEAMDKIIAFWTNNMADPKGGFFGKMASDGSVDTTAPKGTVLNARLLWALSAAYRVTRKQDYLLSATKAKDYFLQQFFDHKHGGVYWSLDSEGERLDTKKDTCAQAFAIYGICEYVRATKDDSALRFAQNLFLTVEKNLSDSAFGGYVEAAERDFSPLAEKDFCWDKSLNTNLHMLEAYTSLYRVWPDARVKNAAISLLNIFADKIYNPQTGHMNLFFDKEWKAMDAGCSFGHEVEASWILLEAAFKIGDIDLINKIRPIAKATLEGGLAGLQPDGSLISECKPDGTLDTDRYWWAQAENVIANLWSWKYNDEPKAAHKALRQWDYIKTHMIDKSGEWRRRCNAKGEPYMEDELIGFLKSAYHNTRMCVEVLHILKHQAL